MMVYAIITMLTFIVPISAEPLLLLSSQLDQLQRVAYVPSKITEELAFVRQGFFLGNVESFATWVDNVLNHIQKLTEAAYRGQELKNILSASQKNVEHLISEAIVQLSQGGDFNAIMLNVGKNTELLGKLNVLIDLCRESGARETCSWIESEHKKLADKLEPIKEQFDKKSAQKKINKIWNEWRSQEGKWVPSTTSKRHATLIIAGKAFDPDTITSAQGQEIYDACSWEGLAKELGIGDAKNLQELVTAKLIEGKVIEDAEEANSEVDAAIIDKLSRLVKSLIGFYEYQMVIDRGEQDIISKVTAWDLASFGDCIKKIASFCQSSQDFNKIQTKYNQLIGAFNKFTTRTTSTIWEEYGGNIKDAWCIVVEKTALDSYESLLKKIVKLMPSSIVDRIGWREYKNLAKGNFAADWSKYKKCEAVKNFDMSNVLDVAQGLR